MICSATDALRAGCAALDEAAPPRETTTAAVTNRFQVAFMCSPESGSRAASSLARSETRALRANHTRLQLRGGVTRYESATTHAPAVNAQESRNSIHWNALGPAATTGTHTSSVKRPICQAASLAA